MRLRLHLGGPDPVSVREKIFSESEIAPLISLLPLFASPSSPLSLFFAASYQLQLYSPPAQLDPLFFYWILALS